MLSQAEHIMFLKLESWNKACIFKELQSSRGTIGLLSSDPPPWLERSSTFIVWRSDSAVSDPTSTGRQSDSCRQILRPGMSDRTPSSFREVTPLSAIHLLLGDDRTLAFRSTALEQSSSFFIWRGDFAVNNLTSTGGRLGFDRQIHRLGRSDRAPSSFGEVTPPQRSNFYWRMIGLWPSDPPPW
ncbi:hypothetical protein E6C27_scaffold121G00860 [Cucumis melo var. makuwa]|uniref:Uncharacterized protein n=1 Tax=Cucumis melo var. makuwa TaxID=1194695 RepID=A0A5A7T7F5_CUCMM|nr:hypothetical protein E6C27_scaffold121G00860 [Cucumis melo var. makuwa]